MRQHEYLKQLRWEGIKNTSGETCPPFGLLAITGSEQRGTTYKRTVLLGAQPSTTFYREFAVNGPTAIPAGKYGRCTRMSGGLWIKYDTGTPVSGEGWGPKPGQWTASKGFPGITCEGIKDAGRYLLLGTLVEIGRIRCKTTGSVSADTTSAVNYIITTGTPGSETDAGFTTLPSMYYRTSIGDDKNFFGSFIDGYWYAEPQEC